VTYIINTVPHQDFFLAPLPGIEEEEAPTSTTFSHVNYAPAANFLALLPVKRNFCKGSFTRTSFTLF
jgi:hypothetical protein